MIRNSYPYLGFALSLLPLVACSENSTEPATTGSAPSNRSTALTANAWIARRDLVPARFELATAAVTNTQGQWIVYAIGGRRTSDNVASRKVNAYNVATNTWSHKALFPLALGSSNGAGVINGKLYVSGGIRNSEQRSRHLYMYDPVSDMWTKKASMPTPGSAGVTGVIGGQLYVLTGCTGHAFCNPFPFLAFYRYDPLTDKWTTLGIPRSLHREGMGGVIGGKFYVVGGHHTNLLEVYDPATGQWTDRATMPEERYRGAAAVVGTKLYVFGGVMQTEGGHEEMVATTHVYNAATDTWAERAPMPSPRLGIGANRVTINGQARIQVTGFASPGNNLRFIP